MKSRFVLRYPGGHYFRFGHSDGWDTISSTPDINEAHEFDSYDHAVGWKNNESHVRFTHMRVIELRFETVDRGPVPVKEPCWEDYDKSYDDHRFTEHKGWKKVEGKWVPA